MSWRKYRKVQNFFHSHGKRSYKDCDCFLEHVKDNSIKYECLSCNKSYSNKIDEELKKRFKNTCKYMEHMDEHMVSTPYEYMDEWEKFSKT